MERNLVALEDLPPEQLVELVRIFRCIVRFLLAEAAVAI
jgi:hypothetical protein